MPLTVNFKKIIDRKTWEMVAPSPLATAAGSIAVCDARGDIPVVLYLNGANSTYLYDAREDGWTQIPNAGLTAGTGAGGAGTCGCWHPYGPSGTATAGTTTTITTNLTIPADMSGYKIRITSGPGAGDERTIASNTYGANSVITVTSPFSATITTSSTYQLLTGRFYFLTSYTATPATSTMRYWDRATGAWNNALAATTNMPAAWGTDGRMVSTPGTYGSYASGTATSATATTIVDSSKTGWATSQWINYQVRITSGTGAGQVRTITASTNTGSLTVATWTVTPTAGSTYVIEGNDDSIFIMGNNATTVYRYSLASQLFTTTTAAGAALAARTAAFAAGHTANWVFGASDSRWTAENYNATLDVGNGRFIYSWGGASLYKYNIASNTWSTVTFYPGSATGAETFGSGSCADYDTNNVYVTNAATGRVMRFDVVENRLYPWSQLTYPNSTAVVGDKLFTMRYTEGSQSLVYVYYMRHTGTEMFRCMDIR